MLEQEYLQEDEREGSPYQIWANGTVSPEGIDIVSAGYCDEPTFLVLIRESCSVSDDWMPKAIAPEKMIAPPEWTARIEAFLDKWGLREKVSGGFSKPGFIHAPYYG